jgi:RecB family exonuclease
MSVWAARTLGRRRGTSWLLADVDVVVFLDFDPPSPACWRVLQAVVESEKTIHVSMTLEELASATEVYLAVLPNHQRLRELGFDEVGLSHAEGRAAGLVALEQSLFRDDERDGLPLSAVDGFLIRGAPQGEGVGRVLAHEVRRLLQRGVPPEEILVLFRDWTGEAELALEIMRSWGLPAQAAVAPPWDREPMISALSVALSLPIEEWETERLVRLLRHGQFRPRWPGVDRGSLATAAAIVRDSMVFRGREQLLQDLTRLASRLGAESSERGENARYDTGQVEQTRQIVEQLFATLLPLAAPRRWKDHLALLLQVAEELGLMSRGGLELGPLREALEDHADVLQQVGRGEEVWAWEDFVEEFEAVVRETRRTIELPLTGFVRLATVDQAAGARARFVILADLKEGTFPVREAVEPFLALGPNDEPTLSGRRLYSREMLRFLRVIGAAEEGVIFLYPSTDLKGQELLRAGFLDDVLDRLSPEQSPVCHVSHARLHPALVERPELVGCPADARVHAVALAIEQGDASTLERLARRRAHRPPLDGAAAALFALRHRLPGTPFSEYEGQLTDGAAILEIDTEFNSPKPLSPSQLETYLACPFHFFSRHVLNLKPVEESDELDEDATRQGSLIHQVLESVELMIRQAGEDGAFPEVAESQIVRLLEIEHPAPTDLRRGLLEITRARLLHTLLHYQAQRNAYASEADPGFRPLHLEFSFGEKGSDFPVLEIRDGSRSIRLRGRIDRIDVAETPDGRRFRVIDYKSGSTPSPTDVKTGTMVQLPIYAMAVERLLFEEDGTRLHDLGYWSLRKDGFRPIAFESWEEDQRTLVAHLFSLLDQVRRGIFVVHSLKTGCENYCEYRDICRVRQVRRAQKDHVRLLPTLSVKTRRGRRSAAEVGLGQETPRPRGTSSEAFSRSES